MASNVANIVFPGQFNPKTEKWCDYKELMLCALDAAGYDDIEQNKARSLFLSQCGKETYALIASLLVPARPTNVSLPQIIAVLDQFYEPEINEILQAGKFHKRSQLQGESVQDYVAAISLLGAKCNFVDLKRQMRDRLVMGMRDERVRRDLLKTKELTYEMALQICLNYQAILPDLYPEAVWPKQTHSSVAEPMEIDKIGSVGCSHCARQHKAGERCRFAEARCYYCKMMGHIAAACEKKASRMHRVEEATGCRSESSGGEEEIIGGLYRRGCIRDDLPLKVTQADAVLRYCKASPLPGSRKQQINEELQLMIEDSFPTPLIDSKWMDRTPSESSLGVEPLEDIILPEEHLNALALEMSRVAADTKTDPILQKVMFHVIHGWPDNNTDPGLQPYWTRRNTLSHNKGCLLWGKRVIVPASLQCKVLKPLYRHTSHADIAQSEAGVRNKSVWWVDMDKQVESIVAECEQCQWVSNDPPMDNDKPWSCVHIDFVGPWQGKTFFVLMDRHSKWLEAEMVTSRSSKMAITMLRKIFASQGLPDVLVSNKGRAFTSVEFAEFLKENGIRHQYAPAYETEISHQWEMVIQMFKNNLHKLQSSQLAWGEKLAKVLFYLRTVPNSSTNRTPAEMLNGRSYRTARSQPSIYKMRTEGREVPYRRAGLILA